MLQTIIIRFVPNHTLFLPLNVQYNWYDSCCNSWRPLVALACLFAISTRGPDVLIAIHLLPSQANVRTVI